MFFGLEPDGRMVGEMVSDRTVEEEAQELGAITEAWGRGTIRMGELTVRAGLANSEILEAGGCVTVRFSLTHYVPPQRVLTVLSTSAGGLASLDIRRGLGVEIAEWEIKNELAALKHLGLVETKGYARGARWILS